MNKVIKLLVSNIKDVEHTSGKSSAYAKLYSFVAREMCFSIMNGP